MVSPWQNSLPLNEYATSKVVICTYQDGWIPITFSDLGDAISIYQKALLYGEEIFVFPPDLAPWSSFARSSWEGLKFNSLERASVSSLERV